MRPPPQISANQLGLPAGLTSSAYQLGQSSDWAGSGATETARTPQPHHRAFYFAWRGDRDLDELTSMWVASIGHALCADDFEGLSYLRWRQFDDHAFLAEVGKDLTAD